MKHPRLSAIFVAVSAATLLMASASSFAGHKHDNFKGEANFKAEVPPCPPILMLHDGFYIGAGVGYDSYRIHESSNLSDYDNTVVPNVLTDYDTVSLNHSATGWMGGLFVGYGHYWDWFYLGAELNGNGSSADSTRRWNDTLGVLNGAYVRTKVEARGSWGIALLPGVKVNDSSLLYIRLGYLSTNFKASSNYNFPVTTWDPAWSGSFSKSKWRGAFNFGVGIETYVAENVSVRGEFDHASYGSHSYTGTVIVPSDTTFVANTKVKPSNNEFMLSLLYHFA